MKGVEVSVLLDRIQNVCERTVYEVTGKLVEFSGTPPTSAAERQTLTEL